MKGRYDVTLLGRDQNYLIFYRKKDESHASILSRVMAKLWHCEMLSTETVYTIQTLKVSVGRIKYCTWKSFSNTVADL